MRALILLFGLYVLFSGMDAEAATKRFKIKNRVSGIDFIVEADSKPAIQPEWGRPKGERQCDRVSASEQSLILSRRTVDGEDLCTVDDHFQIVEEDLAAENTERERVRTARDARDRRIRQLAKKWKDTGAVTNAERDELVKHFVLDYVKELD